MDAVEKRARRTAWLHDLADLTASKAKPWAKQMCEVERDHHLFSLGLDDGSLNKKAHPYVNPESKNSCASPGCSSPGTLAHKSTGPWYCQGHFYRIL